MSQIQIPFGEMHGSIDNATITKSRGRTYMRTKSCKPRPGTLAQLVQRSRLEKLSVLASMLNTFIKRSFIYVREYSTEFNEFISLNNELNVITGDYPDFEYDYSRMIVSIGDMKIATGGRIRVSTGNRIIVKWRDNSDRSSENSTDEVIILLISESKKSFRTYEKSAIRRDRKIEIYPPDDWINDRIHIYILFKKFENEIYSGSVYLGNVVISERKADISHAAIVSGRDSHKAKVSKKYKLKLRERGGHLQAKYRNEIIFQWDHYQGGNYSPPAGIAIERLINDTRDTLNYIFGAEAVPEFDVKLPGNRGNDIFQINLQLNI